MTFRVPASGASVTFSRTGTNIETDTTDVDNATPRRALAQLITRRLPLPGDPRAIGDCHSEHSVDLKTACNEEVRGSSPRPGSQRHAQRLGAGPSPDLATNTSHSAQSTGRAGPARLSPRRTMTSGCSGSLIAAPGLRARRAGIPRGALGG